ncbi:MAG: alpha-amylase family glycosyl hydrolase [Pseudomonadota bacterium]
MMRRAKALVVACAATLAGCQTTQPAPDRFVGTDHPFAAESVYFVVTDRFVDGDSSNNYPEQGGDNRSFNRPIVNPDGQAANLGYLGGDFAGIVQNADYIAEMGFTALWLTPIVDNPDAAFTGGAEVGQEGAFFTDKGKTGYHGYWGVNFFALDEHLVSPGLDFRALSTQLGDKGIRVVLDVVCNHGAPSFDMPEDLPKFGELYDQDGSLVADHMNTHPEALDDAEPLHAFFNRETDIAELSNFNENNPEVLDYFVRAYSYWIDQGASAFRIDTIKHMPDAYWAKFSAEIRERHPDFFMFAESYSFDAAEIARHTWPENGAISVLDFPMQSAMSDVFGRKQTGYERLSEVLHLDDQLYQNPYELMSFYDNHDMRRLDADANGFIDANNWLFTARGIPVFYYGSEIGFRAGRGEHGGNRDYFGAENVERAKSHRIREQLIKIANVRREHISLQRGLQLGLELEGDRAAFLRVYQDAGVSETALVLLNKGDSAQSFDIDARVSEQSWRDALARGGSVTGAITVPAHGVRVLISDSPIRDAGLLDSLRALQSAASR